MHVAESDLREVCEEVGSIKCRYYNFGVVLGLPAIELEAIQRVFEKDITICLTKVLLLWLRQKYNVKSLGPPTWRRLVEAVDSSTGGDNHKLAKEIASRHPRGNCTS